MSDFFNLAVTNTKNALERIAKAKLALIEFERKVSIARANDQIMKLAGVGHTSCITFIYECIAEYKDEFIKHYEYQGFDVQPHPPVAEGSTSLYFKISWKDKDDYSKTKT